MEISTIELNNLLKSKNLTKDEKCSIKHKRRTLKNRKYASTGQHQMANEFNKLENKIDAIDEEVRDELKKIEEMKL